MKPISATALVALLTATIGLGAVAPAVAQPMGQPTMQRHMQQQNDAHHRQFNPDTRRRAAPAAGTMLGALLNFGPTSERLEIALVRLSHTIKLTAEQQTLLDNYKTAALSAQADFASALTAARPADRTARPDIAARLERRITLEKAHVDALAAVQPAFTAFANSLTDAQKAALTPKRPEAGQQGWRERSMHRQPAQLTAPAAAAPANG